MGYGTRPGGLGHTIRTFTPDDTDTEFFIVSGVNIPDLLEKIKKKWPDADLDSIQIEAQYIHTDCLGYDLYDSGDYTSYLKISKD